MFAVTFVCPILQDDEFIEDDPAATHERIKQHKAFLAAKSQHPYIGPAPNAIQQDLPQHFHIAQYATTLVDQSIQPYARHKLQCIQQARRAGVIRRSIAEQIANMERIRRLSSFAF